MNMNKVSLNLNQWIGKCLLLSPVKTGIVTITLLPLHLSLKANGWTIEI